MSELEPAAASVTLTVVTYDRQKVHAEWSASIPSGWTGFQVTFQQTGGPVIANPVVTASTIDINAPDLDGTLPYTITVEIQIMNQPSGITSVEPVIAGSTAFSDVSYDTVKLNMAWGTVNEQGVGGYVVTLLRGTTELTNYPTVLPFFSVDRTLETDSVWTASVAAQSATAVSVGPSSPSRTIILLPTDLTDVSYDLEGVSGAVKPVTQPGMDGYLISLASAGSVSRAFTSLPFFDIPGALAADAAPWKVQVACSSADRVVVGPASQLYQLILLQPALNEVDYDAATFGVAWAKIADATVSGYTILIKSTGSAEQQQAGNVDQFSFPYPANTQLTYMLEVAATNGVVTGPFSGDVTAIVVPPTGANVRTADGTVMKAYFTGLTGVPNVTGYVAELFADGSVAEQPAGTASPIGFTTTIAAGVAYSAKVRATGVKAKGPFTNTAPGPFLTNTIYAYDRAGRLRSVAWDARHTITYTVDAAGNIETAAWTSTQPPSR